MDKLVEDAVERHVHQPGERPRYCVLVMEQTSFDEIVKLADDNASDRVIGMQLDRMLIEILKDTEDRST
jgi:hypothetical protein